MNERIKADILMLVITVFWGTTYVLIQIMQESMSVYNLQFWRMSIAFILTAIVYHKKLKKYTNISLLKRAALLSVFLVSVNSFMGVAVNYTVASNVAFLAGLTVIFVPIEAGIFFKQPISKKTIACVFFAMIGVSLLTLSETMQLKFGLGEQLAVGSAILYAMFILITDRYASDADPISLGIWELFFYALITGAITLFKNEFTSPHGIKEISILLFLSIFCSAFAYVGQNVAQTHTPPSHIGVILSLETVFSAITDYLLKGTILMPINYIGGIVLILTTIFMEIDFTSLKQKKKPV